MDSRYCWICGHRNLPVEQLNEYSWHGICHSKCISEYVSLLEARKYGKTKNLSILQRIASYAKSVFEM